MSKKKTNPRRQPVTMADLNKAREIATAQSIQSAYAIMFTVLRDKHDYTPEQLQQIRDEINDLADSINKGYVKIKDLVWVLKDEADINVSDKGGIDYARNNATLD